MTHSFEDSALDEDEDGSEDEEVDGEEDEVDVDAPELVPGEEGDVMLAVHLRKVGNLRFIKDL